MKRLFVGMLLGILLPAVPCIAASLQYVRPGTPLTFGDSGQSGVVASTTLTLTALAAGAGQASARYDKGAGAQPSRWHWACHMQLTGANVPTAPIEIYVGWSDGSNPDGGLGITTFALPSDKRRNLKRVGTVVVDQTVSNTTMYGSGMADIPTRYFQVAVWNATSLPFATSTTAHACIFTPMPIEMQ